MLLGIGKRLWIVSTFKTYWYPARYAPFGETNWNHKSKFVTETCAPPSHCPLNPSLLDSWQWLQRLHFVFILSYLLFIFLYAILWLSISLQITSSNGILTSLSVIFSQFLALLFLNFSCHSKMKGELTDYLPWPL